MAEKQTCRLQSPADELGNRVDLHPITSAEDVIYDDEKNLKDKIDEIGESSVVSDTKPDHACTWFKPIED